MSTDCGNSIEPPEHRGVSPRIGILGASVVLVLALVLLLWQRQGHNRGELERWLATMRARGEKLTAQELATGHVVGGANTGLELARAVSRLGNGGGAPRFFVNFFVWSYVAPGRVDAGWWYDGPHRSGPPTNHWSDLAAELDGEQEAVRAMREALKHPPLDLGADYRDILNYPRNDFVTRRAASQWLFAATFSSLHEGDDAAAWENLRALLAAVDYQRQEWTIMSQMIRTAIAGLAVQAVWEALQTAQWTDAQLAELQNRLRSLQLADNLVHALEMERAFALQYFDDWRRHPDHIQQATTQPGGNTFDLQLQAMAEQALFLPLWSKAWSARDELFCLRNLSLFLEAVRSGVAKKAWVSAQPRLDECSRQLSETDTILGNLRYRGTHLLVPSLNRGFEVVMQRETEREMAITAIALKRYRMKNGTYPPDLSALAPDFLAEPPRDYINGQSLHYRLNADGTYLLYSVGTDGKDNGGDASSISLKGRLGLWEGRDAVWPTPATPAEIAAAITARSPNNQAAPR